ncbi:MAG: hypothetical protein K2X87_32755 [Gemmataceae bacterium]|nr:hypothetical protein [Gemmataceae bacterium]
MEPTPITLDEATAAKLAAAANGQPVPLHNPAGEVIGYCYSPARKAEADADRKAALLAALDLHYPPEEIARLEEARRNDPRPDVPHEEVVRWLEAQ